MIYKENVIENNLLPILKDLIDSEIRKDVCLDVPLFQTYGDMQIRYRDNLFFKNFLDAILNIVNSEVGPFVIDKCWFNICKKISRFTYHTHEPISVSGVYYLENCDNDGTIFKFGNAELQTICKDNSLLLFDGSWLHKVPEWKGKDRYTIAFDFREGA